MEPRNLEEVIQEVAAMRDGNNQPVEDKIKDLVIGLRRWGINTENSCQGHFNFYRFPWVHISRKNPEDLNKLATLVLAWRNPLKSHWVLKPFGSFWQLQPESPRWWKLWKFQKEAMDFGKFLQELKEV